MDSNSGREVAPYEATLCERLTKKIVQYRSSAQKSTFDQTSSSSLPGLTSLLDEACTAIEYNAKWFAPLALRVLLENIVEAALQSSSSADFFAALRVIDSVCTFSALPALLSVVRFIAYSYYQGSRENRQKKLLQHAWRTAQVILNSHLAPQFFDMLLGIINDRACLQTRIGMAAGRGSLMMIIETLQLDLAQDIPAIEPTQLLQRLQETTMNEDAVVAEQVLSLAVFMLQDQVMVGKLVSDGSVDMCLVIAQRAILLSHDLDVLESIFTVLEMQAHRFEARQQCDIAMLFMNHRRQLSPTLSEQLLAQWRHSLLLEENFVFTTSTRNIVDQLCSCSFFLPQLIAFVDVCVQQYFWMDEISRQDLTYTIQTLITAHTTVEPAVEVLGNGLVRLFTHEIEHPNRLDDRRGLFPILCEVSKHCLGISKLLLSIRADASGDFYLDFPPDSTRDQTNTYPTRSIYGRPSLRMKFWRDAIDDFICAEIPKWEIYDLHLTALASQLRNHALWPSEEKHVRYLLRRTCDFLQTDKFREPPAATGLSKSYIISNFIQILTAMMSYHTELSSSDTKVAIATVINVAGSRDFPVSIQCIHTLSICCYERPDLMAGFMDTVINKMSKMVTQKVLALYVLEFLAGLSRLPALHDDLREEDFKRIFGVCHSYLKSIRNAGVMERKQTPSSGRSTNSNSSVDESAQYVYALAHHVITFWYVALKDRDRRALKGYITGCLQYTDAELHETVEDQGLVTIDLMDRVDAEQQIVAPLDDGLDAYDGRVVTTRRITGLILITTETALRTGKTVVTIRRPSGTSRRTVHRRRRRNSETSDGVESLLSVPITVESDERDFLPIFPDDVSGRTYGRVNIPRSTSALGSSSILSLPEDDESVTRAIQSFDRTSALDSHKAGVIYIGEEQSTEEQILLNTSGSPDYREFLNDIGSVRTLRNADFNSQGLDRSEDADGQYTIVWNNDVTELVYHITTFMPNDAYDNKMTTINKKKHTGNDYVNIVFNNSGADFQFDTFPSAFNYVYIVISPSDRTSYIQARTITARKDKKDRFYNVHVLSRPGFPSLSSAGEVKVVSGTSLGAYVRNLALNSCVFCMMWTSADAGEYPSSWRQRLLMIRRLYEQHSRPRWA